MILWITFLLSSSLGTLITSTNRTAPPLPGALQCSPRKYGSGLSPDSCLNAWGKMPRTTNHNIYRSRPQREHDEFLVPIRYQSDDGLCAIDLRPRLHDKLHGGDIARSVDVSDAAWTVLEMCVRRTREGGFMGRFSTLAYPFLLLLMRWRRTFGRPTSAW